MLEMWLYIMAGVSYLAAACWIGSYAHLRMGKGGILYFIASIVGTPIMGVLTMFGDLTLIYSTSCRHCKFIIPKNAIVCKHCGGYHEADI